jgi:hypothetical protein
MSVDRKLASASSLQAAVVNGQFHVQEKDNPKGRVRVVPALDTVNAFTGTTSFAGLTTFRAPVVTTVALALTEALHGNRVVVANNTTGFAITLPAATGSGVTYTVFYGVTVGAGSATITATGSDFVGGVSISSNIAGVTILANVGDNTITMSGSTTGGVKGTWLRFTDVVSGSYMTDGFLKSTGAEADPFSAA